MEIPSSVHFYGLKKVIKLAKNEITKIEENRTVKLCPK